MNDNNDKIGSLWKNSKTNINGKKVYWYSGNITCPHCKCETKVVEFHNIEKLSDKSPDKTILVKYSPEGNNETDSTPQTRTKEAMKGYYDKNKQSVDSLDDDEIPF